MSKSHAILITFILCSLLGIIYYPYQILLKKGLYDCLKLIYVYLIEGDKVCECYSCLKMMIFSLIYIMIFIFLFFTIILYIFILYNYSLYFSLNVHHLNDYIYIGNCCHQAQFLNKK